MVSAEGKEQWHSRSFALSHIMHLLIRGPRCPLHTSPTDHKNLFKATRETARAPSGCFLESVVSFRFTGGFLKCWDSEKTRDKEQLRGWGTVTLWNDMRGRNTETWKSPTTPTELMQKHANENLLGPHSAFNVIERQKAKYWSSFKRLVSTCTKINLESSAFCTNYIKKDAKFQDKSTHFNLGILHRFPSWTCENPPSDDQMWALTDSLSALLSSFLIFRALSH